MSTSVAHFGRGGAGGSGGIGAGDGLEHLSGSTMFLWLENGVHGFTSEPSAWQEPSFVHQRQSDPGNQVL